ncbi:amino acid transporter AVT1I-like isoform X2 [Punica granatum]|uniref:Amino acid transporter AVT1I-like isoform X2 n=1 Tax=Punica granatum TaxID=22663 RepID=A0A6P8CLH2_PUNGR|nr:amino acid transporter AVT1I-like isoform X2 [Punica granatum]
MSISAPSKKEVSFLKTCINGINTISVGFTREVGFHPEEKVISLRGMPLALSSYTFCYGSHAVFPTIYSSMNKKGQFSKVLWLSFFVCATISFLMAVLGYLIYGHNIHPRITLNLPAEKFAS